VGRTLLSADFDLDFDLSLCWGKGREFISKSQSKIRVKIKIKIKGGGQECPPTHGMLCQVEEQDLGVGGAFHHKLLLVADGGSVALVQALSV
jgi:hypothetical protein